MRAVGSVTGRGHVRQRLFLGLASGHCSGPGCLQVPVGTAHAARLLLLPPPTVWCWQDPVPRWSHSVLAAKGLFQSWLSLQTLRSHVLVCFRAFSPTRLPLINCSSEPSRPVSSVHLTWPQLSPGLAKALPSAWGPLSPGAL